MKSNLLAGRLLNHGNGHGDGPTTAVDRLTVDERPSAAAPERNGDDSRSTHREGRRAQPFRSLRRPPMAILTALDDGSIDQGEQWRIRSAAFVIGREGCDAMISHDLDISAHHVEVGYSETAGGYRWYLRDLNSTNGTFVRVDRCVLRHGQEVFIGGRSYVFEKPDVLGRSSRPADDDAALATRRYGNPPLKSPDALQPRLTTHDDDGQTVCFGIRSNAVRIGSGVDRSEILISDDPFVCPRHASLRTDSHGRWILRDTKSLNGVWKRVNRISLDSDSQFLIGGQRFTFRIL